MVENASSSSVIISIISAWFLTSSGYASPKVSTTTVLRVYHQVSIEPLDDDDEKISIS